MKSYQSEIDDLKMNIDSVLKENLSLKSAVYVEKKDFFQQFTSSIVNNSQKK